MRPILVILALTLGLAYQLHTTAAAAEPPPNSPSTSSTSTESSSSSSSSQESEEANRNLQQNIANGAGPGVESGKGTEPPKDVKQQLEAPGQRKRRPWGFFGRRPFAPFRSSQQRPRYDRRDKDRERDRDRDRPQQNNPRPAPTPDPTALTNFLAAAAFLLRNQQQQQQQQYANKLSINPPLSNSISQSQPQTQQQQQQQQPVGPFSYSQMSNVYQNGQPIPSQVFSSISGPSPSSSSSPFSSPSGPSSSSVVGPSGFSPVAGRNRFGNGGQSHYTNPNASPFQPSSIATSFFSRPYTHSGPSAPAPLRTQTQDYEIAKSHYHQATVLPNSPPTTGSQLQYAGPTASSNLSPQTQTYTVQTSGGANPSAPGSIQYITPTPHKPYAVTIEPGSKFLASHMLNTNQLLSDSERYFKHYNKNLQKPNAGGALSPEQFLKTVSLTGGSSSGRAIPLSYSYTTGTSPKFSPSASSSSFSPSPASSSSAESAAISSLEQRMSLLLNLVPHLVRSGALPVDSLLSPALTTNRYSLPPGASISGVTGPSRPTLSAADLRFLKEQYLRMATPPAVFGSPSGTSPITGTGTSGPSNSLAPAPSAYYMPSSAPSSLSPKPIPPPFSPLVALKPSYPDFDTMYDLLANPSSQGSLSTGPTTTIVKGPSTYSTSSMEVSDPVIVYHGSSSHGGPSEAGHHPFAPQSSIMSSLLNDDRPKSAIGSLLSGIRKLII